MHMYVYSRKELALIHDAAFVCSQVDQDERSFFRYHLSDCGDRPASSTEHHQIMWAYWRLWLYLGWLYQPRHLANAPHGNLERSNRQWALLKRTHSRLPQLCLISHRIQHPQHLIRNRTCQKPRPPLRFRP